MAELRVSPGNLPYRASVSARQMYEFGTLTLFMVAGEWTKLTLSVSGWRHTAVPGLIINYIKDFDGAARGTCCEALAVVIQLRVMLGCWARCHFQQCGVDAHAGTYDHILMGRFNGHCI